MCIRDRGKDLEGGKSGNTKSRKSTAHDLTQRKMEIEFNEGRLWHLLGLLHLAVPAYERCLAIPDDSCQTKAADDDGDVEMRDLDIATQVPTSTDEQGWILVEHRTMQAGDGRDDFEIDELGEIHHQREENFKREAALALQNILALGGDMKRAREVGKRWLVF